MNGEVTIYMEYHNVYDKAMLNNVMYSIYIPIREWQ